MGRSSPTAFIRIKTIGPWKRELRKMRMLAPDIHASAMWGQMKAAKRLVKIVRGHLRNQDLKDWPPLAESTIRKKGGDTRILIHSETYYNNIKAFRKGYIYYAGVKRGVTEPNGIETARVAAIHEFKSLAASSGHPPRPLWAPSIKEMGGMTGIRDIVVSVIVAKLMKRGWNVNSLNLG